MKAFVGALLCCQPLEFYQRNGRRQPSFGSGVLHVQVHLAQLTKTIALTASDAGSYSFEISIMGQQYRVIILSNLGYDRVWRIGWQNVPEPGYGMPASFKELASIFRDIIVREKPQRCDSSQAAACILLRTVETSNRVSVGYCSTMPSSEYPARMKLSIAVTGIRVPAMTGALWAINL